MHNATKIFGTGLIATVTLATLGCPRDGPTPPPDPPDEFDAIVVPEGFQVERVAEGLDFPTSVTWDDEGRMHVLEAGGEFAPEQITPTRIVRIEDGQITEAFDVTDHVLPAGVGLTFHDGAFYFTHRDPSDNTGAVSRMMPDGQVTQILTGILDAASEHQVNGITPGPDGRLYLTSGMAGNAAVLGMDVAPFVEARPDVRARPCRDIVLRGHNFLGPDFRTDDEDDEVLTGAFVPFGEATEPGQQIEGVTKCGGALLAFDANDAEGTLEMVADGFRNIIGVAFDPATGEGFIGENGPDIRGLRPVNDEFDATLRLREGHWYGWPDFSAAREPLNQDKFQSPEGEHAPVFVGDEEIGASLDFVIDHEASGLEAPDRGLVLGLHEINSSPSLLDVAPAGFSDFGGDVFVAEWGDLAPGTTPLRSDFAGFAIARVSTATGNVEAFVRNREPGPASEQAALGEGLERPFDVKFGPDGAMYIVDYGQVTTNPRGEMPPYNFFEGTGTVWRVSQAQP